MSAVPAKHTPATGPTESIEEKFRRLAAVWLAETAYVSSSSDLVGHPAFQEIVGMVFPGLRGQAYEIKSPRDRRYNCIAWAAGDERNWWWPDLTEEDTWPAGAARVELVAAFRDAFGTLGYEVCGDDRLEAGYEKIALFALGGVPKHAARQLPGGRWTSKLGPGEDIEHALHDLTGMVYGSVVLVMKRPLPATGPETEGAQ